MGSSLHRGPLRKMVGVRLLGLLREKEYVYPSSLDPEDIQS